MRRYVALLLCAAAFAAGCSDDDPTGPDRTQLLTGVVAFEQAVQHDFVMNDLGNVRLRLADLRPILVDVTGIDLSLLGLTMGIGNPQADGTCSVLAFHGLLEGTTLSLGLDRGTYCLQLADNGRLPEDGRLAYTLELEITE